MFIFSPLQEKLASYLTPGQIYPIVEAYLLAADAHETQFRSTGEPYITHCVAVAGILADMHMDPETIIAAILHDTVEDTHVTLEQIAELFGDTTAKLVDGVTKLTQITFESKAEAQAENFRKMMLAMVEDIRVILIKMADRYHNMSTLAASNFRPEKRRRIATETLEIYAPIANRLGMNTFKNAFEDYGFQILYPLRYRILEKRVKAARGNRRKLVDKIHAAMLEALLPYSVPANHIFGRAKRLYSIYKKMQLKGVPFSEIMDVYAFRVLAKDIDECYRLLGALHGLYKPIPGRFKDYIAIPKANGYQSLHTTLFGPYGVPIEIQIRTAEMEITAKNGIAAHWLYKTQGFVSPTEVKTREWLEQLLDMQSSAGTSMEFIEHVKIDLFPDEVYVFTPKGDIMRLPRGATTVDFAYAVHTQIGNRCIAAKVNRRLVPLNYVVSNGQTVEVVTSPKATPNPSWLNFVVSAKAKTGIRHFLKSREEEEAVALGKKLLSNALAEIGLSWDTVSHETMKGLCDELFIPSEKTLLKQLGSGERNSRVVVQQLTEKLTQPEGPVASAQNLQIMGSEGMNLRFAKCCYPIPGDEVRGILCKGQGIEVHTTSCPVWEKAEYKNHSDDYVSLNWAEDIDDYFPVKMVVETENVRGAIAFASKAITDSDCNIREFHVEEARTTYGIIQAVIEVKGRVHLARVLKRLKKQQYVMRAYRVKSKIVRDI
ncbi:MAG: bifunctional (p)ppGpp synthetase/guanosine-3',5'-bis(diphosphate) 3'-pyrophosphohydrolase [Gammaproteobacteria bacterium]|nr:bifunctional (p)ppGpp synthetase/guanosine-3',5'-bis(diphosphate) 3'-pyrophosphohydrolase [Gammaproteobacteria bacterium]